MSDLTLLQLFRSRWLEMSHQFWPEAPAERLRTQIASLSRELARRQSGLILAQKRIEKVRDRLVRREQHLAMLALSANRTSREAGASDELELHRLGIVQMRERLQELEYRYASNLARLRRRKQKWTELRERLLSGSVPKQKDGESDPDYPF